MKSKKKENQYVIGVDAGATKTLSGLANLNGKILDLKETSSSNPRNVGIKKAAENISCGINKLLRFNADRKIKKKIVSIFIGLPGIAEEYKDRKDKITKEISKRLPKVLKNKIIVESDQLVAFRAATDEKRGIVLISGTGCVAHGWDEKKEAKSSGWGYLADEGSAFWTGQRVLQAVLKDLDGRGEKTKLTKGLCQKLKVKTPEGLVKRVYEKNTVETIALFSLICNKLSAQDKVAKNILKKAGYEASLAAKVVIKKLNFQRKKFPLVLAGGMFNSDIFLKAVKLHIRKTAPLADLIVLKKKPIIGAIKLAIECFTKRRSKNKL